MITLNEIEETISNGVFKDNWHSLNQFEVPKWFTQSKFGIFIHWGLYSVPAYRNEWYARNMYIEGYPEYTHHRKTYGDQATFGFQDFIPLFKAENFDSKQWLDLFKKAGAKYIVPVAEHHDGFQMYSSDLSKFNAKNMGPKKDVLKELQEAAASMGLHFGVSSHRAEHWWFFGNGRNFTSDVSREADDRSSLYWPAMAEAEHQLLDSQPEPDEEFVTDWLLRTCELIKHCQPEIVYFDWWIQHQAFSSVLKKAAAYYYNMADKWEKEVAICYKHDALAFGSGIPEVERGLFKEAKPFYWQTDTAVARNSWCYTETLDYKESYEIICDLIEVVAKNGNLLLNIGPKKDGTIPEKDREILLDIGNWLEVNGEGIYDSKPWRVSGEGPTEVREGQFQEGTLKNYTSQDIRYTTKGSYVYGFVLGGTDHNSYLLTALGNTSDQNNLTFHRHVQEVELLGEGPVTFSQEDNGLIIHINFKQKRKYPNMPITFKIKVMT